MQHRSILATHFTSPALSQVVEDQFVERVLIGREDVSDAATGAPILQAADEGVQVSL